MKMKLRALVTVCLAFFLLPVAPSTGGQSKVYSDFTTFVIMKGIAPINMSQEYAEEIFKSLRGEKSNWNPIPVNEGVPIEDMFCQWGVGNYITYAFEVSSSRPFLAGKVRYKLTTDPVTFEGNMFDQNGSSSIPGRGIWFGPDQIRGTADDEYYSIVTADTLVNVFDSVGTGSSFERGDLTIEQATEGWKPFLPRRQFIEYSLGPNSISATSMIHAR
jgi:hypothetical protein